jgi:hypothetical protein
VASKSTATMLLENPSPFFDPASKTILEKSKMKKKIFQSKMLASGGSAVGSTIGMAS